MRGGGVLRKAGSFIAVLALAACAEAEPPAHLAIPGADPARGKALIGAFGCGACHVVEGVTGANGLVAPRLENFASRTLLAGIYPNAPRFLVPWLMNPPALKPGTGMPDLGVAEMQARDIASYLYTLGGVDVPERVPAAVTDVAGEEFRSLRAEQKSRLFGMKRAVEALAAGKEE